MKLRDYFINLSLKKKWSFSTALVLSISYAAICIVIYFALYNWLYNNEQNGAIRTVDDLSSFFNSQDGPMSLRELQDNNGLMKSIINQNQTVRIFNMDGYEVLRINNHSPVVNITLTLDELLNTNVSKETVDGEDVIVVSRFVQIGLFQGYMQLIHPLTTFHSMMQYMLTAMLIAGIGAILLAGIISFHLSNLLMKPLEDLRDSMITVKEKGFEKPIKFSYKADDEIGDLLKMYLAMMDELQQSFAKQQQFVSDASHELRTPIQAIEGHLSLIQRWGKKNPEVLEESLNTSIIEVRRMKKMIEELLHLARREKRDEHSYANVERVLTSVKNELQMINSEAEINIHSTGEVIQAHITENALAQIVRNIIENGIRYNIKKPIIEVKVHYLTENIFITIKDNGIGIHQENLNKIFDRFYRVDDSREHTGGGTGLGLSITKMLAEKYNVEIEVSSKIDEGTVFTLRFPL
ncbi:HAMP domain-containing sensor histidine kinase [Ureibacillus acetophenoni]|uniref:Signal transduction histidine-protein kinase ArlS n=1 Tax=Ureibacillus acetophenoni TaxID=614649 RepID=A0A285UAS9_9BACL|nr:HAMP domain-containing histidine kinase [Ureibacillus acetophenoni]SOC37431.1 two-component system sensor histidine kinase ArlS [Ureibacillus acetophenoni]